MTDVRKAPSTVAERERQRIMAKLGNLGFVLPGSISARRSKCGNPGCICHQDPTRFHGPYHSWTRTLRGKTVTRNLTDDQVERYQPWFDDARQLRDLVLDLKRLSLQVAHRSEGWELHE